MHAILHFGGIFTKIMTVAKVGAAEQLSCAYMHTICVGGGSRRWGNVPSGSDELHYDDKHWEGFLGHDLLTMVSGQ